TNTNTYEPACPICKGAAIDPDFGGECNCVRWLGTASLRQPLAEKFAGETTYALPSGGNGTGKGKAPEACTEKQRAFARKLAGERPNWSDQIKDGGVWERCFDLVADGSKFVSKSEASAVIDALLAI